MDRTPLPTIYNPGAIPLQLFTIPVHKYELYFHYALSLCINNADYRNQCGWYRYLYCWRACQNGTDKIFALLSPSSRVNLTLEGRTDMLSQKSVNNYKSMLSNIPEERKYHLYRDGSLN
jgi:hypothetical protein